MTDEEYEQLPKPACYHLSDLFYSPELDGRLEKNRVERETRARHICWTACLYRRKCLERVLKIREPHGVWGGMTEQERREFLTHLKREGWGEEVPQGEDLTASLNMFYRSRRTAG